MNRNHSYRRLHIIQYIVATVLVLAFLFVAGTEGSLENDAIGLGQACLQFLIGCAVLLPAAYATNYLYEMEAEMRRQDRIVEERRALRERRRREDWDSYFCG